MFKLNVSFGQFVQQLARQIRTKENVKHSWKFKMEALLRKQILEELNAEFEQNSVVYPTLEKTTRGLCVQCKTHKVATQCHFCLLRLCEGICNIKQHNAGISIKSNH